LLETKADAYTLPFVQSRPEISGSSMEIVEAFSFLNQSRTNAMSVGTIPFSEIVSYANLVEPVDFWGFIYLVQVLDAEFVSIMNEKQK